MYLVCDIYGKLMDWKKESHAVLELEGIGGYGKACVFYRFTKENFNKIISIDLLGKNGQQFLECYKGTTEPGSISGFPKSENPIYDALRMFHPSFEDSEDTIIIIDEIQESPDLYHQVYESAPKLRCRFIITGNHHNRLQSLTSQPHKDLA